MDSDEGLIVDVGMHRGDDTGYYLAKGFNVLAIEANPQLVQVVAERFPEELESGRLRIVNVAVADRVGELDFYVGEDDLWGSTDPRLADRGLHIAGYRRFTVPCVPLANLLAEHPVPHYVKIDVEGRDGDCVRSLLESDRLPAFLSFEVGLFDEAENTFLMRSLAERGYRRFSLVNQATHARRLPVSPPLEGRFVDVKFTTHMSGPFGEEAPGPWLSVGEVLEHLHATERQQALRNSYNVSGRVLGVPMGRLHRPAKWLYNSAVTTRVRRWYAEQRGVEVGGWFDVHASLN